MEGSVLLWRGVGAMIRDEWCFKCGCYESQHPNSICEKLDNSPNAFKDENGNMNFLPPRPATAEVLADHVKMLLTNLGFAMKGVVVNRTKPAYIRVGDRFEPIVEISSQDGFVYVEGTASHMERMERGDH